ncbi:ferrous iron transport protein A [Faecalicatena contorta]|uniref:Ferrous iron transport protein A n=1 Tax=Faecalicatena fissicatena TaxID=290055 RepID=A0ABS2E590_9FIRM|nr:MULTISPECIES: FeoA family protein [Faecalicatena]MBM6684302.1 ferrous iron transport protein A [Faecalicatena contorta]MBM6709386.1 ferrous iron transport protein A [Faecalicatena contorta]MBM6736807.1 ferrous iron transport protein A [Faecalicatena fissicatena]
MNSTPSYTVPSSAAGSLADLHPGMEGRILGFREGCRLRLRLLDLGFVPGTLVKCTARSPLGDPCAYLIRQTVIALRNADAAQVDIAFGISATVSVNSDQKGGNNN